MNIIPVNRYIDFGHQQIIKSTFMKLSGYLGSLP